jgi:hypothetical protein
MAEKKIIDVQHPEKVTASSSSRPILVTNRPVLTTDPMMTPVEPDKEPVANATHTAKIIQPVEKKTPDDTESLTSEPEPTSPPVAPQAPAPVEDKPEPEPEPERDSEAEANAAAADLETARVEREAELENLIASGTYALPIGAAHRRRSRFLLWFFVLIIVLVAGAAAFSYFMLDSSGKHVLDGWHF